jgi:2-phospho-L-lactate guanylyltransferase
LNRPAVLVPFKAKGAKSRLSGALSSSERRVLSELLLSGVLGALGGAGLMGHCYVVSSDRAALSFAEGLGASPILEPRDAGVNVAVEWGISKVPDAKDFMVVPSDLPLLRPSEVRHAMALKDSPTQFVISPSRAFDGTNLLFMSREARIPFRYDDNSFWNHVEGASRAGLKLRVDSAAGFVFDVDTEGDLTELAGLRINSPQARFARKVLGIRGS